MKNQLLDLQVFLALDYSQAEIRMLAEVSKDPLLLKQFQAGQDIHSVVGSTLTGWPVERIRNDVKTRRLVKNMVFAIIYGVSRNGLYDYVVAKIREQDGEKADISGINKNRLGQLYDAFFKRYTGVRNWIETIRAFVEANGYVETLFGFRREINKNDTSRETFWANQAVNSPIQGSAHQLMLMAMAILHQKPKTYHLLQTPVMEVHDALYFYVKLRHLQEAFALGKQLLEKEVVSYAQSKFKITLHVPLIAEADAGFCLGSLVKDYRGQPPTEFLKQWRTGHLEIERKSWEKLLPDVSV